MPLVFVDTNVLLYAVDEADATKQQRARDWLATCWQRRIGRVSSQVMHEFYWNARRKFAAALSAPDARAAVRRYQAWNLGVIDQDTVEAAWAIESHYRLAYWDALMLAAASEQGCSVLLTEDLQHDQLIDGVRILNPFVVGPEWLDAPPAATPAE